MMKRKWEQCPHSDQGTRWSSIYVTMNPKGVISLSKFTFEKLGEPAKVIVLYDRIDNTIGLQPVSSMTKGAFRLCAKGSGGRMIHALRLIQEFRLKVPRTLRFMSPTFDDDGILLLDLNDTRPAQKGQNGRGQTSSI